MISGGEHIEHPIEYDPYIMEGIEMEKEVEREYEEWMWEQVLKEGPPQNDDSKWLKRAGWRAGRNCVLVSEKEENRRYKQLIEQT